jgi:hypothetical protein
MGMNHFQPSNNVTDVFQNYKGIQNMMGIDLSYEPQYPILFQRGSSDTAPPLYLTNVYPTTRWTGVRSIKTSQYDTVHPGIFVLVSFLTHMLMLQIETDYCTSRSKDKEDTPMLPKFHMYGKQIHHPVLFS